MKHLLITVLVGIWANSLAAADQHEEKPLIRLVSNGNVPGRVRPGHPEWPMAWMTYRQVASLGEDIRDLQAHGVGLISCRVTSSQKIRESLEVARRTGMKYHIDLPEVTEEADLVRRSGLEPVSAIMIGGVYDGKAIDRHVFSFTASEQEILLEPPVYSARFPYGSSDDPFGHYFPEIGAPLRAEVIVPLRPFDGQQHLKIIPATINKAPAEIRPPNDSVMADMPDSDEILKRTIYVVRFDLTELDDALLDKVGLAVYWRYDGYKRYWMFGRGTVSAWATSTQAALRAETARTLRMWAEANGGDFPSDIVLAARFGDECFYTTGHLNGPAVNYPLWDYSEPSLRAFRKKAGPIEYPRTWGYPKIYGPDAYAWWLYNLHEGCARLCGIVREEIARVAPGLLLFRNTTRMDIFHPSNDFDGSGQELLTQNLDIVHFDPYPVSSAGYKPVIPRDMSYGAGLARRYGRLLVPWMQAHTYAPGKLTHVSPEQVVRMAGEQWVQGVDAIIWLGYGSTFPAARPASWERAGQFHKRLLASPPPKPKARLAVLRPYRTWALSSQCDGQIRNPADWMLQQWLQVWSVRHGQPYDVFEVPPGQNAAEHEALQAFLKSYRLIVSTVDHDGARIVGEGAEGTVIDAGAAEQLQSQFEKELIASGWLTASRGHERPSREKSQTSRSSEP